MPFGAELHDGVGRFRLWAPGAASVALELSHARGRRVQTMRAEEGGWYCAEVGDIAPEARYSFRIDERVTVPDPASRFNPQDVHGASALVDPLAFEWSDDGWTGRRWAGIPAGRTPSP